MDDFTDGRYLLADTDAKGARDPIALTSQVKFMRDWFEHAGHVPVLILCVVSDAEREAALARIKAALDGGAA